MRAASVRELGTLGRSHPASPQAGRHRVESQNSGGSLRQGAPSGFLHGGSGGARGSPGGRIWGQSPRSSQSLRLQSRSSRRATLSFSDSLSWWMTWGRNAERGASDTARVRRAGQSPTPALCWLGRGFEHPQESFPVPLSWEMASYGEADF